MPSTPPPPPPPIATPLTEPPSPSPMESRFSNLRSVRWRIYLGILPSSPSSSIEDHRRVTADSRRRYANLRRRLLVDPHLPKDGNRSLDPAMDNPLSQNPDSMWGRFFRNAELERTLDQDLSRLYPEHGSYFQTPACQAMLRRILLLWCLRHPEYGYRQGMHELLAPLLYVLHVDIQRYFEVRKKYENYFTDEFDETSFPESDVISNYSFAKSANWDDINDSFPGNLTKASSVEDLDPEMRDIILLSDAYGSEGELGILLSERFMEHDAYCMFDALMSGAHGVVAMADFFSPSPPISSSMNLPPVIEASSALYHLLSIVDSSLHSHLVELGVEPQYFAMRWLRVLFGREFSLKDLLIIWDEVFSSPNSACYVNAENNVHPNFKVLSSSRGAFISAMAVTMILHLRSSLLATEHATSCLQKLLNFPENIDVKKLIGKAKSLQSLALDVNVPVSHCQGTDGRNRLPNTREHSLPSAAVSPKTPHYSLPESYWEKQWRVLHKEEESQKGTQSKSISNGIIKGFRRARASLSRTESDPSPAKSASAKRDPRSSVRRNLLDDLSREADPVACPKEPLHLEVDPVTGHTDNSGNLDFTGKSTKSNAELICSSGENSVLGHTENSGNLDFTGKSTKCKAELICSSGENSGFSPASSPLSVNNDHDNDSEESSVASNSCVADNDEEASSSEAKASCCNDLGTALPAATEHESNKNVTEKQEIASKEKKILPGKFQWFWRFGRGGAEGNLEKVEHAPSNSITDGYSRAEVGDKNVVGTLRNLGHSMLENIQVIESFLQQEFGQSGSLENLPSNILGGKGQATAVTALKELRKISNLLSEM